MGQKNLPNAISNQPWKNWGGNQEFTPSITARPTNESEVVETVRYAIANDLSLRVAGAGHSFTPVVETDGVLLDLSQIQQVTGVDSEKKRVRALGGTAISEFGEPMWKAGLSLQNQGDIDKQAIAGAISTATHGSGIESGSFSSTVTWVRLINGHGEIVEIDQSDLRLLRAAQVAVGTLGVILEVELQAVSAYYLREQITYETTKELLEGWGTNPASSKHFSFLWCQAPESAGLYELPTPPDLNMVGRAYTKRYWAEDIVDEASIVTQEGQRHDRAYRIYPGGFGLPFHELEYYVGVDHAKEAWIGLKELIEQQHPDQKYPIETRWTKAEDGYISPFYKEDKVSLSVSGAPGTDYEPYLKDVDKLLQEFDATVHWGKIHLLDRERVDKLFPEAETFREIRRDFDPNGVFLNKHTRELFS